MTLCRACSGHLTKVAKHYSDGDREEELKKVNEELSDLGHVSKGNVKVKNVIRFLLRRSVSTR